MMRTETTMVIESAKELIACASRVKAPNDTTPDLRGRTLVFDCDMNSVQIQRTEGEPDIVFCFDGDELMVTQVIRALAEHAGFKVHIT